MTTQFEIEAKKLVLSTRYQARKKPGQVPLTELADSIYAQTLLQNLVVVKGKKRGTFEVVAGGRRLQGIQILLTDGRWANDAKVWVKLVENEHALEASITENVQRENMHPADEFEAFAALMEEGKTIEDVAARFGVNPTVVKRRLKLAHVAPELIQEYREGQMTLEILMAFTVSDDQDRQREVWTGLDSWSRQHPQTVRHLLTEQSINGEHQLVKFVGLEAYHAAGGRSYQDLFANDDDGSGIYLQDQDILMKLAQDMLRISIANFEALGWAWVEGHLSYNDAPWSSGGRYGQVYAEQRKLSKAEAAQVKTLTADIDTISAQMDALAEADGDDEAWLALDEKHDTLIEQRDAIQSGAKTWTDEAKQISGVGIYIDSAGKLNITYGLIRPQDRQAAQEATANIEGQPEGLRTSLPAPSTRPQHSERLVRQLTANKVGIVAADLAGKPDIALAVLVAQLARNVLGGGYFSCGDYGLGISVKQEGIAHHAPDFEGSKAGIEMAKYRQHWLDILPLDEDGQLSESVLDWTLTQDTATLIDLLAYLLATSVQGVQHQEPNKPTTLDRLATVSGVEVAKWWEPTGESYLQHVSKDQIATAITEAVGADQALPVARQKKAEAVTTAEKVLTGKGWLPSVLHVNVEV